MGTGFAAGSEELKREPLKFPQPVSNSKQNVQITVTKEFIKNSSVTAQIFFKNME